VYVSCATPGTKHWRVDVLEADEPEKLAAAEEPSEETRANLPG
jgi:hypothetical protein